MSNEAFDALASLIQQQREASIKATPTFEGHLARAFA
jgi:hypothetical protein